MKTDDFILLDYVTLFDECVNLPKKLFTKVAMNQRNALGETVWHIAAKKSFLNYIPQDLFNAEALNQKDYYGSTPFHNISEISILKHIPEHAITQEVLMQKNAFGETVWEIYLKGSDFMGVPEYLISEDLLNLKNRDGIYVLYKTEYKDHIQKVLLARKLKINLDNMPIPKVSPNLNTFCL